MDNTYRILKHIATLAVAPNGWTKEINVVGRIKAEPRIDIREWPPDKKRMGRGITLTMDEAKSLTSYLAYEFYSQSEKSNNNEQPSSNSDSCSPDIETINKEQE